MIKFNALIQSFHEASLSTHEVISSKNLELLSRYFEETDEIVSLKGTLDDALKATEKIKEKDLSVDKVEELFRVIKGAKNALEDQQKKSEGANTGSLNIKSLVPRMVKMQYPVETKSGYQHHDVYVPLISLIPISMPQVREVKIVTELEFALMDDEIVAGFPQRSEKSSARSSKFEEKKEVDDQEKFFSKIEITFDVMHGSDGLKKIIEGYDKALRAQIPG